ncbi:MAG: hydantoinase/carbamoylase family amidase [Rhodospirillales bacterium]
MVKVTSAKIVAAVAKQREMVEGIFDKLREDALDAPGVTRDPYGPGEQMAHFTVGSFAHYLGLEIDTDAAANLYMTLPGRDRRAPKIIIGSHLDSVPHGGNFDGAAGVVAGLAAVAALQALNITPACDVTVMAIRAEESIWFQVSYIGSRGALGTLPEGALDMRRIDTGRTLAEHIAECEGDPAALATSKRYLEPADIRAYLELHIEQAPSLVEAGKSIGICTGIPGNFRYPNARIEGANDHVGLPRRFRRDAAMAGAEFAMAMESLWAEYDERGIPMACTFGRFYTDSSQHGMTIVPGAFHFSLDVRAYDEAVLAALDGKVDAIIAGIEQRRGVRFHRGPKARAAVGPADPAIAARLHEGSAALGIDTLDLGSPASHDGAAFAERGIPIGMIFIKNTNGSHNPYEAMTISDFLDGTNVLVYWLAMDLGS